MKDLLITTIAAVLLTTTAFAGPIHVAAEDGDLAGVQAELDKGVDVNVNNKLVGSGGGTPLHYATTKAIAELLIANGADLNAKGVDEWTPLHGVVDYGNEEIVALLIAEGADVNAKDKYESTPLHIAATMSRKEIIKLLIAKGADMNAKNDEGRTPLDEAVEWDKPEIADLLRKHGGKTKKELEAVATKSSDICSTSPPRQSRARRLIGVGRLSVGCYRLPLSGL